MARLRFILAAMVLGCAAPLAHAQQPVMTFPAPWSQVGIPKSLSATTVTGNVQLGWAAVAPVPNPPPPSLWVCNTGTVAAYVSLGGSGVTATTATGFPIMGGTCNLLALNGATYLAGITASGSTTLTAVSGSGGPLSGSPFSVAGGGGMLTSGANATSAAMENILAAASRTISTATLSGTTTLSGLTQGSIPYIGSSGVLSETNVDLNWDNSGKVFRASANTGAPQAPPTGTVAHVAGADSATVRAVVDGYNGVPQYIFRRANGTAASPTALTLNDQIGSFGSFGYHSGGGYSAASRASILSFAAENWTSTAQGAYWAFYTAAAGGTTLSEKMRLTDAGLLTFGGGATSSFPALKRSSTTLQARLADDSAFAPVQGKLTTDTNYTAGTVTETGYLTLYDATGTAYKVNACLASGC